MVDRHGLVNQALVVDTTPILTLASLTALIINQIWTSPEASFLMKRYRMQLLVTGLTIGDDGPLLVMLAHGNATIAEVATAMQEINAQGPTDITETLTQDNAWAVYQNTVQQCIKKGDGTEAQVDSGWVDFGGRRGIPNLEEAGVHAHIYNAGGAPIATGASISGLITIQGVWLRG